MVRKKDNGKGEKRPKNHHNVLNKTILENLTPECGHQDNTFFLHFRSDPFCPAFLTLLKITDKSAKESKTVMSYLACDPDLEDWMYIHYTKHDLQGDFGEETKMFTQDCHPQSAVWASYTKGSGVLEVTCYECKAKLGTITLSES